MEVNLIYYRFLSQKIGDGPSYIIDISISCFG